MKSRGFDLCDVAVSKFLVESLPSRCDGMVSILLYLHCNLYATFDIYPIFVKFTVFVTPDLSRTYLQWAVDFACVTIDPTKTSKLYQIDLSLFTRLKTCCRAC